MMKTPVMFYSISNFSSAEERTTYIAWRWENNQDIIIFVWTISTFQTSFCETKDQLIWSFSLSVNKTLQIKHYNMK